MRGSALEHAKLASNLHKGGDCLVQVLALVRGRQLYTNARLALGHYGVAEADLRLAGMGS